MTRATAAPSSPPWSPPPDNPYFAARHRQPRLGELLRRSASSKTSMTSAPATPPATSSSSPPPLLFSSRNKFDLRELMREILQSETYQRCSNVAPGEQGRHPLLLPLLPAPPHGRSRCSTPSRRSPRVPTALRDADVAMPTATKAPSFPSGWRAMQLPDANTNSYFTKAFGRAAREVTCECERTAEPSVTQALHISQRRHHQREAHRERERRDNGAIGKAHRRPARRRHARRALPPRNRGRARRFLKIHAAANPQTPDDKRALIEDAYWALLSSREFLFNH